MSADSAALEPLIEKMILTRIDTAVTNVVRHAGVEGVAAPFERVSG